MPNTNMRIEGLEEALRFMQTVGTDREIKTAIRQGMRKAAKKVVSRARELVHRRSGTLAKSIGSVDGRDENNLPAVITGARISEDGWYAHFEEYGTSGIVEKPTKKRYKKGQQYRPPTTPHPFMRPAIDQTEGAVREMVAQEVGNAFGKKMERQLKKVR